VKIPVVGAAASTFHVACQIADNYAVVGVSEAFERAIKKNMALAGVMDKMHSYKNIDTGLVLKESWDPHKFETDIIDVAKQQVKEGAHAIVVACGILFSILTAGAKERMESTLGVPVLDMQAIGLHTAVMWVNLKIAQSKTTYPQADPELILKA